MKQASRSIAAWDGASLVAALIMEAKFEIFHLMLRRVIVMAQSPANRRSAVSHPWELSS